MLPTHLDEKVAALHLDKLGVKLTALSAAQNGSVYRQPALQIRAFQIRALWVLMCRAEGDRRRGDDRSS
jgi:S-adenosyl-L-homocysteine hydrolase